MFTLKQSLGLLAVFVAIISSFVYFYHIFKGQTKPHALTWLVWTVFTGMGFAQQWVQGGGAGSWAMGMSTLLCFLTLLLSLKYGEKEITSFDWISLAGAACALGIWILNQDPVLAIILVALIDLLGFFPTFRKSYHKPYEETLFAYNLTIVKYFVAFFALESYSFVTYFYPLSIFISHLTFVLMVEIRRRQLERVRHSVLAVS